MWWREVFPFAVDMKTACCWTLSPAESRIQLSLVCPLAQWCHFMMIIHPSSSKLSKIPQLINYSYLLGHNPSGINWIQADVMSFPFCLFSLILLFLLQLKKASVLLFCTSAVLRPDSLSRHTWCEWWRSESLHRACLSWCVGLCCCACRPSAERWLAICDRHYSFVLPSFNRWNVLCIVVVTTVPHQLAFIYWFKTHPLLLLSAMLLPWHQLLCSVLLCCIFLSYKSHSVLISSILFRIIS